MKIMREREKNNFRQRKQRVEDSQRIKGIIEFVIRDYNRNSDLFVT